MGFKNDETEQPVNSAKSLREIISEIVDYSTSTKQIAELNAVDRGLVTKEEYIESLREYVCETYAIPENDERIDEIIDGFSRFMWSYYILDPLIADKDISDIRIVSYDQIYIKKNGCRKRASCSFIDNEDYTRFIERVALKNAVNLSDQNALQKFTDSSQDGWILRFNIATKFVNSSQNTTLHIRKHSKTKYTLKDLVEAKGMMSWQQANYLKNLMETGQSILFCGAGGSGKTTLLNTLLEFITDKSIFCIQEADELFMANECEFTSYHVIKNRGEGKISYELKDLAPYALVDDVDVFVLGEIKGEEALDFITTVYTGATGYGSVHAPSEEDAYMRIADLVKRASDYSTDEIMYMLRYLDNVVFMKNFKVQGISKAVWNSEKRVLEFKKINFDSTSF